MQTMKKFAHFCVDDSGAVTVDWVVLTAAIVGLGMIVVGTAAKGISEASTNVAVDIQAKQAAGAALYSDD